MQPRGQQNWGIEITSLIAHIKWRPPALKPNWVLEYAGLSKTGALEVESAALSEIGTLEVPGAGIAFLFKKAAQAMHRRYRG